MAVTVTGTDVTCYGARDGMVASTTTGGTTAYSYAWYSTSSGTAILGQTASTLTGRSPGTYYVRVTDANGCSVTSSNATITQPAALLVSVSKTNVSCYGGSNATANAAASGGNAPYTYTWTNASSQVVGTTYRIVNVPAGSYTVQVLDSKGCVKYGTITITQPAAPLTVSIARNGTNHSATATPAGGTAPYTYLWSNGQRTATATNLTTGVTYSVRVTDSKGCTVTGTTVALRAEDPSIAASRPIDARVYPNPTNGKITLEFNAADQDHFRISVVDFSGRLIHTEEGTATMGVNFFEYDLSTLAQGIYLVTVQRDSEMQTLRVIMK